MHILLAEDEDGIARTLNDVLREAGHEVEVAADGREAMARLDTEPYDLVITDIRLPFVDGLTIFRRIRKELPATEVILMSAYGTVSEAVAAMQGKAAHYLSKPFELNDLLRTVDHVAQRLRIRREVSGARDQLRGSPRQDLLIGRSAQIRALRERILALSTNDVTVLITGESGVGKELVAQAIHEQSQRRDKPLVAVNCTAFPETLLEAELFGYERGAFTGAFRRRDGRFKAAQGGTLFLDEIGEMTPMAQAKLLRVFEEGVYQPLGTNMNVRADVRVLTATNIDLAEHIRNGSFREDLYYRLKVFVIDVPPLRQHREDIPLLVEHFLRLLIRPDQETPGISPAAWAALSQYDYPGNVRELKHAIQHALVLCRGEEIELDHLPSEFRGSECREESNRACLKPLSRALAAFERQYLIRTLDQVGWSKTRASEILEISRKNLWEKLRKYGIDQPDDEDVIS